MDRNLWYFKQCSLFENLTEEQARRLDSQARFRKYKKNDLIYSPSEPGQTVFILGKGQVKIKDLTPEGKESILAFIDEGEIFGELALIDDSEPRQEYAEAASACELLIVPGTEVLRLMEQRSDIALSITKLIGLRRRRIENRLRNVLFLSSRERMIRLLLELVESHGQWNDDVCRIKLSLSHQEIASLIGVTRETVTAVLGKLQAQGLIRVQRRKISVVNWGQLQKLATAQGVLEESLSRSAIPE